MAQPRALAPPSALRPAPPRATTPLPGSFALRQDPSTQTFDEGTVLLGGSPLRLFRISERARELVDRWRNGAAVGPRRSAQILARRLASGGAFNPEPTSSTLGPTDVTVVVPVRDRPAQLDRLLDQLEGEGLACIVVDDASADAGATKEIAERHGAAFMGLSTNVGPAGARNVGLAAVHTGVAAFVDSDCVPSDGWLGPLLGHFDDPVVAAVAPRIVAVGGSVRAEASRSSLDRGIQEGPVRPGSRIPFVPSAALLVRSDVAVGSDLFDAALRGGEDVDLVWRLGEAGWDVRYVPSSTVGHQGPANLKEFLIRRAFYGTTAGPLSRRHGEALAPVHLSGWSLLVWSLLLARRPVLALTALSVSIVVLARRLRGLVRDPVGVATQIAGRGTARAALPALASLTRAWAPAFVLGLAFRRTRRAAALALVVPALHEWAAERQVSDRDPVRAVAAHVADDVAYGSGVWIGCAREKTLVPLIPRIAWRARVWSTPALREGLEPSSSSPPPSAALSTDG
jgi:mycofactocin system glycosyltransferase